MRQPNLFIVGAAKAGTTSLWRALGEHPEVFMSPLKEPHFFSGVMPRREWAAHLPTVTTQAEYEHLFNAAGPARYLGDASTSYLWSGSRAAEAIWRHNPRARIIAVLRDPVDRAYSHYWNDAREGLESRSFEGALADELDRTYTGQWGQDSLYIDAGRYLGRVGGFLEYFGEQMLILAYEDLSDRARDRRAPSMRFPRSRADSSARDPARKRLPVPQGTRRPIRAPVAHAAIRQQTPRPPCGTSPNTAPTTARRYTPSDGGVRAPYA